MLKYYSFVMLLLQVSQAQIVPLPKYNHERLTFGMKLKDMKGFATWKQFENDTLKTALAAQSKGMLTMMFIDTVVAPDALIRLSFFQSDSTLNSIQLIIGESSEEKNKVFGNRVKMIWDDLGVRLGSSYEERDIPLFGLLRKWSFDGRRITALQSGKEAQTLVVTYTKK